MPIRAKNNKGVHVATPKGGEHVQHIHSTPKDRAKHAKQFREQKEHERKIKDERFAAIRERQKNKPGGSGAGIDIKVKGD